MFTTINYLSNYPNMIVTATMVKNGVLIEDIFGSQNSLSSSDYVFLKVKFNGLKKFQRFSDVAVFLTADDIALNEKINLYYIEKNNGSYYDELDALEGLNTRNDILFTNLAEIFEREDKKVIKINLGRFFKNQDTETREIMVAINFPNATNGVTIDNPSTTATWSAGVCDTCGINPVYKYDEHSFDGGGNVKVNLFNGQYTYTLPLLQSVSDKMPISFSLYQADYKDDSVMYLKNKLIPNFYYKFYLINTDIIIENPSGLKMCYTNISRDEETYKQCNIKHTEEVGDLYYCSFDRTYFYYNTEKDIFKLYDKNDNLITIDAGIDFTNAKIMEIESKTGEKLTYHWNGNQLLKITNSDNEEMRFVYTSDGYISKVYIDSISQYVEFTDSTNGDNLIVNIKTYNCKDTTDDVVINDLSLSFTNGLLNKIYNNITYQFLSIWFNDTTRMVNSVGIFSEDGETISLHNYSYTENYTRVSDYDNKFVYYYFDSFGRAVSVMDDNNRTITYNYQPVEEGISRELISVSKVQTNNRNLLDNGSFESKNFFNSNNSSWHGVDFDEVNFNIEDKGVLSEKCLKIHLQDKESVTIYQNIVLSKTGTYKFSGFVKHPEPADLENGNLTIGINGTYQIYEFVPIFEDSIEIGFRPKVITKQITKTVTLDFTKTNWYAFEINDIVIPTDASNINLKVEVNVSGIGNIVYLDDFQFTNGLAITRNNFIENGYMETIDSNNLPYGWEFRNFETSDKVIDVTAELHSNLFENKVMKITESSLGYSKRMYQEISTTGLGGEKFIYTVFGKLKDAKKNACRAYIKFFYKKLEDSEDYDDCIYFIDTFEDWQSITGEITTKDNYYGIEVGVICNDVKEVLLDCFQLYKESFGSNYKYDYQGNLTEASDGESYSKVIYDENNRVVATISKDGIYQKYFYNEGNVLIKTKDMFGDSIEYDYDDTSRLIRKTITSESETISMSNLYDDVDNTERYVTEFGDATKTSLDYLKRVKSQLDPLKIVTNYVYNNKLQLDSVESVVDSKTLRNNFVYNNDGTLNKVIELNGVEYEMTYDSFNRITKISCGPLTVEQYEYDSNVVPANAQVTKKTLSNFVGCYEFEYNKEGQVSKVKLNSYLLATYEYDDNGNLYRLKDELNNITHYYSFDSKGNLLKEFSSDGNILSYEYNHLGNLNKVVYKAEEASRSVSYEYPEVAIMNSKENFIHRLVDEYKDDILVDGKFLFGGTCKKGKFDSLIDDETGVKMMSFSNPSHLLELNLKTLNSNRNKYELDFNHEEWIKKLDFNKTIYMFIKPSSLEQLFIPTNILLFGRYLLNGTYISAISSLKVNEYGKLTYCSSDGSYSFTSNESLKSNEWNLVGITFSSVDLNSDTKVKVFLNEEISDEITVSENVKDIEVISFYEQNSSSLQDRLALNVGLMSVGSYCFNDKTIKGLYRSFKQFYKHNMDRYLSTTYYDPNAYKGFDVITLHGSLQSEEGLKPTCVLSKEESYKYDKYKLFEYDSDLKRCVFKSYEENSLGLDGITNLQYQLPVTTEATLSLRFKYNSSNKEKYLLSILYDLDNEDGDMKSLEICINERNILEIKLREVVVGNLGIVSNEWNHLVIRSSTIENRLEVNLNNQVSFNFSTSINLSSNTLTLGNTFDNDRVLNGCIEMFAYAPKYITDEEVTRLFTKGTPVSVRKACDQLGRIKENQIRTYNNVFTTTYQYNKTIVTSETLPDGTNISYKYDQRGNILNKIYSKIGQTPKLEIYTYDELGRLKSDIDTSGKLTEYTYDSHGNIYIIKETVNGQVVSDKHFNYQRIVLTEVYDVVNSVTTQEVMYDNDTVYPSCIISYNENELVWDGNRLIAINDDIRYTYNYSGIRIGKETPFETTSYILEGSNIISMNKVVGDVSYRLDFTYDANNQLVGLTTSEGNYFYIKDILNNIIGLIDSDGNYVVKYIYNVWGKLLSKDILIPCIAAEHNPFMYKGYYYDEETQFYWVSSRYYLPDLCRFIQPADVSSLNPQSINGLNLYSYANNNPIGIAYSSFGVGGSTSGGMVSFISLSGISNGSQLGGFNSSSGSGFLGGLISGASSIYSLLDGINSYLGGTIDALINYIKIPKFNSLHKKLSSCSKWLRRVGIGLELVTSAYNNYKNDDLTYNQKWASFGADVCYIAAKSGLSYLAGELVTKGSIAIGSSFAFTLVGASIGGITITFSGAIIIGACVVGVGIVAGTVLIAILTNAADNWWESKKEEWFN